MTPDQIPQLLQQISYADPRILRDDPDELRGQAAMWYSVLRDVPYDFALNAVGRHYANSPFPVLPADIAAEWKAEKRKRLDRHVETNPHPEPDDELAYRRQLRSERSAVVYGQQPVRDIKAITAGIGRAVPERESYMPPDVRKVLAEALPNWGAAKIQHPELAVDCPYCRAYAGKPCRTPGNHRPLSGTHPSRKEAHAAQQGNA
jgi:hypothetical protein